MAYECVNEEGTGRIKCVRYADDSLFEQLHAALLGEASKGCDGIFIDKT